MKLQIALSAVPISLVRETLREAKPKGLKQYDAIFNKYGEGKRSSKDRIYVPLNAVTIKPRKIEPPPEITNYVHSLGMRIDDYFVGTVIMADGKRTIRLGKVLSKKIDLLKMFENDPERKAANMTKGWVVFSRHPYDVMGMSFDRGWTSCMNLEDGSNRHYVANDVKHGTLVAYVVKDNDKNINAPMARIAIKPYYDKAKAHFILVPGQMYGTASEAFTKIVQKFCHFVNSHAPTGQYKLSKELYDDLDTSTVYHLSGDFDPKAIKPKDLESAMNSPIFNPDLAESIIENCAPKIQAELVMYRNADLSDDQQLRLAKSGNSIVCKALAHSTATREPALNVLLDANNDVVLTDVASNTSYPDILAKLAKHPNSTVRYYVAYNDATPVENLSELANDEDSSVVNHVLQNAMVPVEILQKALDSVVSVKDKSKLPYIAESPQVTSEMLDRIVHMTKEELTWVIASRSKRLTVDTITFMSDSKFSRVRYNLAKNKITPQEVIERYADSTSPSVLAALSAREDISKAVILKLAARCKLDEDIAYNLAAKSELPPEAFPLIIASKDSNAIEVLIESHALTDAVYDELIKADTRGRGYLSDIVRSDETPVHILNKVAESAKREEVFLRLSRNLHCEAQTLKLIVEGVIANKIYETAYIISDVIYHKNFNADVRALIEEKLPKMKPKNAQIIKDALEDIAANPQDEANED